MSEGLGRGVGRTIAVFTNAVRWGVSNEDDHFASLGAPVEVEGVPKCGSDGLRTIAAAACIEGLQVFVNTLNVRCEAKVLGDVCVVLRRMVTKGDQADAKVLGFKESTMGDDVCADPLDMNR